MTAISNGDRVKLLCTSRLLDGTHLDSEEMRQKPYWIRAGAASVANGASEAILGMSVGESKTVTTSSVAARPVTLELQVIEVRAGRVAS